MSELRIVNSMLRVVGEAPVSSLNVTNPYVQSARDIIERNDKQIQGMGWHWNSVRKRKITSTSTGQIVLPSSSITLLPDMVGVVQMGSSVLNINDFTLSFEPNKEYEISYVSLRPLDTVPDSYIFHLENVCCVEFAMLFDGDNAKVARLSALASNSLAALKREMLRHRHVAISDFKSQGGVGHGSYKRKS